MMIISSFTFKQKETDELNQFRADSCSWFVLKKKLKS